MSVAKENENEIKIHPKINIVESSDSVSGSGFDLINMIVAKIPKVIGYVNKACDLIKKILDMFDINTDDDKLYIFLKGGYILSVVVGCLLILILTWKFIQGILSFLFKLPDLPFSNKTFNQVIYSFYYSMTSSYLIFFLVLFIWRDGKAKKESLDLVNIIKKIVSNFYIFWLILGIVVGSAIAKTLYTMSCAGEYTNIAGFGKIVDSSVILIFLIVLVIVFGLRIRQVFNILNDVNKVGAGEKTQFETCIYKIFYICFIFLIFKTVTIFIEKFSADNLNYLVGNSNIVSQYNNCVENSSGCESDNSDINLLIYMFRGVLSIVIWGILVAILVFQFNVEINKDVTTSLRDKLNDVSSFFMNESDM